VAAVALFHDIMCGCRRSATARAAIAAPRPLTRRPQRNNKTRGGRRAITPVAGAARHPAKAQQQVRQPPNNNTKGSGRSATTSVVAAVQSDVRRRPLRVPCSTSVFGGRPLVRPPSCKRDKGGGCRRPTLCCRHRK